jgi:hypothetical protein
MVAAGAGRDARPAPAGWWSVRDGRPLACLQPPVCLRPRDAGSPLPAGVSQPALPTPPTLPPRLSQSSRDSLTRATSWVGLTYRSATMRMTIIVTVYTTAIEETS